jgi:hypothetical protein
MSGRPPRPQGPRTSAPGSRSRHDSRAILSRVRPPRARCPGEATRRVLRETRSLFRGEQTGSGARSPISDDNVATQNRIECVRGDRQARPLPGPPRSPAAVAHRPATVDRASHSPEGPSNTGPSSRPRTGRRHRALEESGSALTPLVPLRPAPWTQGSARPLEGSHLRTRTHSACGSPGGQRHSQRSEETAKQDVGQPPSPRPRAGRSIPQSPGSPGSQAACPPYGIDGDYCVPFLSDKRRTHDKPYECAFTAARGSSRVRHSSPGAGPMQGDL